MEALRYALVYALPHSLFPSYSGCYFRLGPWRLGAEPQSTLNGYIAWKNKILVILSHQDLFVTVA